MLHLQVSQLKTGSAMTLSHYKFPCCFHLQFRSTACLSHVAFFTLHNFMYRCQRSKVVPFHLPLSQLSLVLSLACTCWSACRVQATFRESVSVWMAGKLVGAALGHVCSPATFARALRPTCARRPALTALTTRSLQSSRPLLHSTAATGLHCGCCSLAGLTDQLMLRCLTILW